MFVSCLGYAAARRGQWSGATENRVFWLGQALILIPICGRLLSRRHLSNAGTATLVIVWTIAEYLLKVCYSPLGFTFNDEFLHWRGTTNMLASGKLFEQNYGLPIGTYYPGIEEVTSALISATGLSVFQAGLVVAGLAHLLFICFLYLAFVTSIRSHRIAGIALMIYYGTPALTSFNSMFVYETLALAFLGFCVLAALKAAIEKSPGVRNRWFALAILSIFATVVTHHVTSYMLTGFLILVGIASMLTGSRNTAIRFGILATISATAVVCWIAFVAPTTIGYFSPTVQGIVQGISALQNSGTSSAPTTSAAPVGDQILEAIGIVVVAVLIVLGCWQAWKRHRTHPWILAMTIGSLGWFVALAVRLGTPDGQELAGRTATFVYIPVSVLIALALTKLVNSGPVRRWGSATSAVVVAAVVTLLFDGLANGWPPYWERLPGPHLVASFERSVGPEEISMSYWTLSALGPGNRIATDAGNYQVLIGYGGQDPLQAIQWLFATPKWTTALGDEASAQQVHYVLVDLRLAQSAPPSGTDFPGDPAIFNKPVPLAILTKFDHVQGIAREFDDGNMVLYNLMSLGYVPVKYVPTK